MTGVPLVMKLKEERESERKMGGGGEEGEEKEEERRESWIRVLPVAQAEWCHLNFEMMSLSSG